MFFAAEEADQEQNHFDDAIDDCEGREADFDDEQGSDGVDDDGHNRIHDEADRSRRCPLLYVQRHPGQQCVVGQIVCRVDDAAHEEVGDVGVEQFAGSRCVLGHHEEEDHSDHHQRCGPEEPGPCLSEAALRLVNDAAHDEIRDSVEDPEHQHHGCDGGGRDSCGVRVVAGQEGASDADRVDIGGAVPQAVADLFAERKLAVGSGRCCFFCSRLCDSLNAI